MRLLFATLLWIVTVLSCGGNPVQTAHSLAGTDAGSAESVDVTEEPIVGKIYAEAIRKARVEITADNAGERLRVIEREIEQDLEPAVGGGR